MTELVHGRDRPGRAERPDQVTSGPPAHARRTGLVVVGGTGQPEAAEVASGFTPAEAEVLGDYHLYNG